MKKRLVAMLLMAVMATALLAACGDGGTGTSDDATGTGNAAGGGAAGGASGGSVNYLNFKPEVDSVWQTIAKEYTTETGVPVKVTTAAAGTYATTLKSAMAGATAPTLFQINGPVGYAEWKDHCLDLTDTDLAKNLQSDITPVKGTDGKIYGVPFAVESYGIIYNDAIMQKYFGLSGAKVTSMDQIDSFNTLEEVVTDMQSKKSELGIDGVFSSTSLKPGEDWRWNTHLLNLPIHYEFKDAGVTDEDTITFKYNPNFKQVFDMYTNHSVSAKGVLGSIDVATSMAEFAMGQSAMVQNGNWAWSQIEGVTGNTVQASDIKFLPIYFGVDDAAQGLCTGTENFWAINSKASAADIQATKDFVSWLITSDKGKAFMYQSTPDGLGNIAPFTTFTEAERPNDPLATEIFRWMGMSGKQSIPWDFVVFPSQTFKNDFGQALLQYATGNMAWDQVVSKTVSDWSAQKANPTQ